MVKAYGCAWYNATAGRLDAFGNVSVVKRKVIQKCRWKDEDEGWPAQERDFREDRGQ